MENIKSVNQLNKQLSDKSDNMQPINSDEIRRKAIIDIKEKNIGINK